MTTPLLEMKDVHISFTTSTGVVEAVRGVNMSIYPGQSVAIVGESGSGKSTTAMSILGLLPGTGKVTGGQILFEGEDKGEEDEEATELYERRSTQPEDRLAEVDHAERHQ